MDFGTFPRLLAWERPLGAPGLEWAFSMTTTRTEDFSVKGMTCGSCVGRVEGALLGSEGVSGASVNLADGKVQVTYASETEVSSLIEAVSAVGYEMAPISPSDGRKRRSRRLFGRKRG